MKRILVDTNVVLDILLDRQPFVDASAAVWDALETGKAVGVLPADALTTIHYLLRTEKGNAKAKHIVSQILSVIGVAKTDGAVIQAALQLGGSDFEDAVSAAAAMAARCDFIVTRDPKGLRDPLDPAVPPEALLALMHGE